jgi:hypothetical protein
MSCVITSRQDGYDLNVVAALPQNRDRPTQWEETPMYSMTRRSVITGLGVTALTLGRSRQARAAKNYDVGVTDTEIKLGTTSPYSGPASAYGIYGSAQSAGSI